MRFAQTESGEHRVAIHIIDEDGQMAFQPVDGKIQVNVRPEDGSAVANIVLNIHGLRFDVDKKGHKTWLVDCVKE